MPYGCRTDCEAAPKRRRPRQPHPGTRIIRYRCFLPDLAEFANYRRGGTDGATIDFKRRISLVCFDAPNLKVVAVCRSKFGGESGIRTRDTFDRIHTFQACSFNHSDTSPILQLQLCGARHFLRAVYARLILSLTPHCVRGQPAAVQICSRQICRTRDTFDRIHTFQACSFNHSDTSPCNLFG
jgi:hypothetical protein